MVASQEGSRVEDLDSDEVAGQFEAEGGSIGGPVLRATLLHVLVPQPVRHPVKPSAVGEIEHGDVSGKALLDCGCGQLSRAEQADLGGFHEARFLDDFLTHLHYELVAVLADDRAVFLHIEGQGVVAGGRQPPHLVLLGRRLTRQ